MRRWHKEVWYEMNKYAVVTESHLSGDDKIEIDVPQRRDVKDWISEQVDPITGSIQRQIKRIEQTLRTKVDKSAIEKYQTDTDAVLNDNLTAIEKHIRKMPDLCERDFKQMIAKNITPQIECFAQQIQMVERQRQEAKAMLSVAGDIKRDCETLKTESTAQKTEILAIKKDIEETLRQITEQANNARKMLEEITLIHEMFKRESDSLRESIYEPRGIFKFLFKKPNPIVKPISEKQEETNNGN